MSDSGVVAILFTDVVGSTDLLARLGDDAAELLRREHFELLRHEVAHYSGDEVKSTGDGLMVVFHSPLDSVGCAVAIQQAVDRRNRASADRAVGVRVGLNIGEPARDGDDYYGLAVNVAKRLCDRAHGAQILATELVAGVLGSRGGFRFVSAGRLALKGVPEPVPRQGDRRKPMSQEVSSPVPVRLTGSESITPEELALAARNHGMPLEALRWPVTPIGLHYLLTHYDIPAVDSESFTLTVDGRVARPRRWSPAELAARPARTLTVTMECAGNGRARLLPRALSQPWLLEAVGTADWTGTPLRPLLEEAGPLDDAVEVVFTGLDVGAEVDGIVEPYQRALPIDEALGDDVLLSYGMNGGPLPPHHGFPLRLVVPGWYGMGNVKWLSRITVMSEPFTGFQNRVSYRMRQTADEVGVPMTRMEPRALMVPPGAPDFFTRRRLVNTGSCELFGRAWSGWAPIAGVEVSVDGAATWHEAKLSAEPVSPLAWWSWTWRWEAAAPGDYELCCRARDGSGRIQPLDGPWNLHGFANNALQRVPVTVR